MTGSIDDFARSLFDEAKAYLEAGRNASSAEIKAAYFHASLLVGFCAFEAHVNSISEDFHTRSDLSLLDQSILREKEVRLMNGEYQLTSELKMFRLDDRVQYLFGKFSTIPLDRKSIYWGEFRQGIKLRNALTHPKTPPIIEADTTERALKAILDVLNTMYKGIYQRPYPIYNLGIKTTMTL